MTWYDAIRVSVCVCHVPLHIINIYRFDLEKHVYISACSLVFSYVYITTFVVLQLLYFRSSWFSDFFHFKDSCKLRVAVGKRPAGGFAKCVRQKRLWPADVLSSCTFLWQREWLKKRGWGEGFPVICPCSNKFLLQNVFGHYLDWFSIIFPFLLHLNVHMDCPGNDEVTSGDPNLVRCLGGLLLFVRFFIIPSLG